MHLAWRISSSLRNPCMYQPHAAGLSSGVVLRALWCPDLSWPSDTYHATGSQRGCVHKTVWTEGEGVARGSGQNSTGHMYGNASVHGWVRPPTHAGACPQIRGNVSTSVVGCWVPCLIFFLTRRKLLVKRVQDSFALRPWGRPGMFEQTQYFRSF